MDIKRCGVLLGAEVTGVDLTKPLESATLEAIRQAHAEHGVLVFPGQKISSEDLKRFGDFVADDRQIHAAFRVVGRELGGPESSADVPIADFRHDGTFAGGQIQFPAR